MVQMRFCVFEGHGPRKGEEGGVEKTVKAMFFKDIFAKMLEHIRQQKNIRQEIMIVILLQVLNFEKCPNVLGAFVVFGRQRLVVQGIAKQSMGAVAFRRTWIYPACNYKGIYPWQTQVHCRPSTWSSGRNFVFRF